MSRESDTNELIKVAVPAAQLWAKRKAQNYHTPETKNTTEFVHTERIAYESFMAGVKFVRSLEI